MMCLICFAHPYFQYC